MINPFKSDWQPNMAEIHEYIQDLQRITLLRDKSDQPAEIEGYTTTIHVMQEVLIYLNTIPNKRK